NGLGGLRAIAISHPHFYTTMVEWSREFGGIPIPLGQKIESVERRGVVPVQRSLGNRLTNYTLRKEARLKVGAFKLQPSGYKITHPASADNRLNSRTRPPVSRRLYRCSNPSGPCLCSSIC